MQVTALNPVSSYYFLFTCEFRSYNETQYPDYSLLGIQEPFALGEVHRMAVFVFAGVGLFKAQEVLQFSFIGAGQPAGFIERQ